MRFCGGCGTRLLGPAAVAASGAGTASTAPGGGTGEAHRRHMTVMFCDIVGSTPLAETLDPEDFREILTGYQEACARATGRYHGYTARYAGDGIVLYFGYNLSPAKIPRINQFYPPSLSSLKGQHIEPPGPRYAFKLDSEGG